MRDVLEGIFFGLVVILYFIMFLLAGLGAGPLGCSSLPAVKVVPAGVVPSALYVQSRNGWCGGVTIDHDRAVTASHCVPGPTTIVVDAKSTEQVVRVLFRDDGRDLVWLDGHYDSWARLGYGIPTHLACPRSGLQPTPLKYYGIEDDAVEQAFGRRLLKLSPLQSGDSGSPVYNASGEVVGIAINRLAGSTEGYAVAL